MEVDEVRLDKVRPAKDISSVISLQCLSSGLILDVQSCWENLWCRGQKRLCYLAGFVYSAPKKQRYTPIFGLVSRLDCFVGLIWKDHADMVFIDNI